MRSFNEIHEIVPNALVHTMMLRGIDELALQTNIWRPCGLYANVLLL